MNRQLIWDLPVRLFHVLFGLCFVAAFSIAEFVDDDSSVYAIHMILGLVMASMVVLRLIWGLVGTRPARLAAFFHRPGDVIRYLVDVTRGRAQHYASHNPGTSVAALTMFALSLGLATTGLLMKSSGEWMEEVHEIMAITFLVVVLAHLAGVALHTWRQRENIALSMIDGKKFAPADQALEGARPIAGLVFLVLVAAWTFRLFSGYDSATGRLTLSEVGQTFQLGEGAEEGRQSEKGKANSRRSKVRRDDD